MVCRALLALVTISGMAMSVRATLFDFNAAGEYTPLPINQVADGIKAQFLGDYSVQLPTVSGVTPVGFTGLCLAPSNTAKDLTITFSTVISDFSILYAPQELACDSSATMRAYAYMDTTLLGYNDQVASPPGTWPSATLSYSNPAGFNKVVVHYQSRPPTGGDYGSVFLSDNVNVTALPEAGSLSLLAVGMLALLRRKPARIFSA